MFSAKKCCLRRSVVYASLPRSHSTRPTLAHVSLSAYFSFIYAHCFTAGQLIVSVTVRFKYLELLENVKRSAYSIPTQRLDLYRNVLTYNRRCGFMKIKRPLQAYLHTVKQWLVKTMAHLAVAFTRR